MAVSARVRQDPDVEFQGDHLIKKVGKKWRVYEDASSYSSTTGGYTALGKVMRDSDDRPVSFDTLEQAQSWIEMGCRLEFDRFSEDGRPLRDRPIFDTSLNTVASRKSEEKR